MNSTSGEQDLEIILASQHNKLFV